MNEEGKRWMAEINTFPPGAAPCLIRMDYTDTDVFSGTLTLMLKTVQEEKEAAACRKEF